MRTNETLEETVARRHDTAREHTLAIRDQIVANAASEGQPGTLADLVNDLASAIGAETAWFQTYKAFTYTTGTSTVDRIRLLLTDRLLRGADDTWSGRGNDAKRSEFDGFREAAQRIIDLIED